MSDFTAFYLNNEYWFAVVQLVLAMVGMGATLTPKDILMILLMVSVYIAKRLLLLNLEGFHHPFGSLYFLFVETR